MTDTEPASVAPVGESSTAAPTADPATRLFSRSIVISGIRCMLAYVVFPWILPLLGVATGVGPFIGIVIGVVAIGFNVASIRRFWISKHRWRHAIAVLNGSVIVLLTILLWIDLRDLVA